MFAVQLNKARTVKKQFSHLFTSTSSRFSIDLSGCTLVQVLRERQAFVRKNSPNYTNSSVVSLILDIEEMSGEEMSLMPYHVNGVFYNEIASYLIEEKGLQPETVKNYFQKISGALHWAASYGAMVNPGYRDYNIKTEDKQKYALNIEEIIKIYEFDLRTLTKQVEKTYYEKKEKIVEVLRNNRIYYKRTVKYDKSQPIKFVYNVPLFKEVHLKNLERVKDMFVLSCMLYQRYSDMRTLKPENFSEHNTVVKFTQQKTGGKATVKINELSSSKEICFKILEKYNYYAPYNKNINSYNKLLHELLHIIGSRFDESFSTERKLYGEIKKTEKPLWQCITSHTARRTAITIATRTKNEFDIRRASGHKDGRSFARYICEKE